MRVVPLAIAAALAMPWVLPAAADHRCGSDGWPALGIVAVGPGTAGSTTFYVDDRNAVLGHGIWIYEESNGLDWLQRGGYPMTSDYLTDDSDDPCRDFPPYETDPDRLVI